MHATAAARLPAPRPSRTARVFRWHIQRKGHQHRAVPGKDTQHCDQVGADPIGAHDPLVEERIRLIPDVRPGTQHAQKSRPGRHLETEGEECSQADEDRSA